jgi:hypothetical protein
MNNNYLDQFEKTNLQVLNSATKKRNKNTTKSYNNNVNNFDNSEINNYVNNLNYSTNLGQMTNKSVIVDTANYNSNHTSIVKNYDNSFNTGLSSSKGVKRPQSS